MGLREYPILEKILELAAHPTDPIIREKALKYFIDNFNDKYRKDYNDQMFIKIAFLPCSNDTYAKPLECFIDPECTIMKFRAIRQDLRFEVEKLGVRQGPSHFELKNSLIENPPRDEEAREIFEYMASRNVTGSRHEFYDDLANHKFIPVPNKIRPDAITYTSPNSCFFIEEQENRYIFG